MGNYTGRHDLVKKKTDEDKSISHPRMIPREPKGRPMESDCKPLMKMNAHNCTVSLGEGHHGSTGQSKSTLKGTLCAASVFCLAYKYTLRCFCLVFDLYSLTASTHVAQSLSSDYLFTLLWCR